MNNVAAIENPANILHDEKLPHVVSIAKDSNAYAAIALQGKAAGIVASHSTKRDAAQKYV
ncbi:MAG TPA: hypothetical protein VGB84_05890 [Arachidicoccus sp.]